MSGDGWLCRNKTQFDMFVRHIAETWDWKDSLSIKWTSGAQKSMGQLALVHVWIRHITLHMNKLPGNDYEEEAVKTYLKRRFGVKSTFKDPMTGELMPALKSYSRYEKGEMTHHMNLVSAFASEIGCSLPVWGEYNELTGRQVA